MPELPGSCYSLVELTDKLSVFIETPLVRQITGGIHVNDAFIHDAWGALPPEWTAYWDALPDHRLAQRELIDSIDESPTPMDSHTGRTFDFSSNSPPPESLDAWLKSLKSVSLPRTQRPGPALALPETLASGMKTKKLHEVSVAAAYIHQICNSKDISHVIDMGSGQGYLSATLAFLYPSLRILAIDGSESQVAGSRELAASLGVFEDRLKHLIRYVDGSAALAAEMEDWAGGQGCMLVGLHACGRLSEHMLRYFNTCTFISHIETVGCCYNHIVPRSDSCPDGFPISARLRKNNVALSPTALMAGCQAPNNWERSDLAQDTSIYSKKQFYRAVLEKLLFDKGIHVDETADRPNYWGIRKGDLVTFEKFTARAMHCLGIDRRKITTAEIVQYETRYRGQEGRIAILVSNLSNMQTAPFSCLVWYNRRRFPGGGHSTLPPDYVFPRLINNETQILTQNWSKWTLSVLCCKAIETCIALDRYWYLVEHKADKVDVVPIFDYKISPRNLMMVAEKR